MISGRAAGFGVGRDGALAWGRAAGLGSGLAAGRFTCEPVIGLRWVADIWGRAPPPPQETSRTELKFGACRYDVARKQLTQHGDPVHLTIAETELLHILAQKANEAIERSDLGVTEENGFNPRTIDVQITRLRRKIEPDPRQPRYLQTVRGTGYILRTDP